MQYRYLFFDLDGTLWDSREGITKAVRYALEQGMNLRRWRIFINSSDRR